MTRKKGAPQRINEIYEDTNLPENSETEKKPQQGAHISSKPCGKLDGGKSAVAATSAVVAVKLQSQQFPVTNNAQTTLTDRHQSTVTTTNGSTTTMSPKQRSGSKQLLQYRDTPATSDLHHQRTHATDPTSLLASDKKISMHDSERLAASPSEDALQTAAKRRCWSIEENDNKTAANSGKKGGTPPITTATCGGGPVTKFRKISQGSSSSGSGGRSSKLHQESTSARRLVSESGKTSTNQISRNSTSTAASDSSAASSSNLSPTQLFFETMLRHQLYEQCQNSWMYAQQQRSDNNCLSKSKAERYRWCVPAPSSNGSNCNHKTGGGSTAGTNNNNSSGGSGGSQKQQHGSSGGGGNIGAGSGGNHNSNSHVSSLKRSANLAGCDVTPMPEKLFSSVFSGASQFSCRDCGSSFDTLVELTVHMSKTDHFRDFNGSSSHNDKSEGSSGGGGSSSSGGIPNNKKRRLSEQEERGSENVLTCMECKHSFDSLQDLSVHMMKTRHYENVPSLRPWTQHQHHYGAAGGTANNATADGGNESASGTSVQAPTSSTSMTSSSNRKKMTSASASMGGGSDKHMNGHHHQLATNGGGVKNSCHSNSSSSSSAATTSAAVTSSVFGGGGNHHINPAFNSMLTNLPNPSAAAAYYSTMMYFYPWLAASLQNSLLTTSGFPSVPFLPQHAAAAGSLFPLPTASSLFGLDERMAQYAAACQLRQLMSGMAGGSGGNDTASAGGNKDMQQQMPSLDSVTAANALKYSKLLFKNQLMSATQLQQHQQRHQQEVAKTESSGRPITSPSSSENTSSPGLSGSTSELNPTQMDFINMLEGTVHSALSKVQTSNVAAASSSSGATHVASVLPSAAENKHRSKISHSDKTSSPILLHQASSNSSLSDSVTAAPAITSSAARSEPKLLINNHPSPSSGRSSVSGVCNSPLDLTLKRGSDPTSPPTSYTSSKSSPQRGSGNIDLCLTTTTTNNNNIPQRHITRSPGSSNNKLHHRSSNTLIKREFSAYTGTLPPKDPLQSIKDMFETRAAATTTTGTTIERQQLATPPVTCTATNPLREMLRIVNDTDKYSGKLNNVCQPTTSTTSASAIASTTHNNATLKQQRHNQTAPLGATAAAALVNQQAAATAATSDSAKLRLREFFDELVVPPAGSDADKLNPIYDLQQMVDMKLNAATSAPTNNPAATNNHRTTSQQRDEARQRSNTTQQRNNGGGSDVVLSPYRHANNGSGDAASCTQQAAVGDACQEIGGLQVKTTTSSSSKSKLHSNSAVTPPRPTSKEASSASTDQVTMKKCAAAASTVPRLSEGSEKKTASTDSRSPTRSPDATSIDDDSVTPLILQVYFARRYSSLLCQNTTVTSGGKPLSIEDTIDEDEEVNAVAEMTGLDKSCVKTHIRRMIETFNSGSNLPFIKQELQQQQQKKSDQQQQQSSPTRTKKRHDSTVNFHCCVCLKSSSNAEDFTKHVEEHHQGGKNATSTNDKTDDKPTTAITNNDATNNKTKQQQKESCNRSTAEDSSSSSATHEVNEATSPSNTSSEKPAIAVVDSCTSESNKQIASSNISVLVCSSQDSEITTTSSSDDVIRVTS